eukprot:4573715-Amphidinium_carterae.1
MVFIACGGGSKPSMQVKRVYQGLARLRLRETTNLTSNTAAYSATVELHSALLPWQANLSRVWFGAFRDPISSCALPMRFQTIESSSSPMHPLHQESQVTKAQNSK